MPSIVVTPNLLAKVVLLSPDGIASQDRSEVLFVMSKHRDKLNVPIVFSEQLSCKRTNFHCNLFLAWHRFSIFRYLQTNLNGQTYVP